MSTINLLGLQRPPKKMKDDSPLSLSSCKHRNSEARKILFERFSFRSQFPLVDGEKHAVEFLDSVRQKASEPQYKKTASTNNIPAKEIVQKTRHKNINSLNNYSAISDKKIINLDNNLIWIKRSLLKGLQQWMKCQPQQFTLYMFSQTMAAMAVSFNKFREAPQSK